MAGVLLPISTTLQYFDNTGQKLSGGTVNTFTAGTTTPINTYTDSTLAVSNGTSLTLDGNGRPTQEMWVAAGTSVKVIIKDASSNQIGPTLDNLTGLNDSGLSGVNRGPYYAGTAGGTANAITLTVSGGPTAYVGGQITEFTATSNNSGATTYNTNGLGPRALQNNGSALTGVEIINGRTYIILDTGSAGQLLPVYADPVTIKDTQTITGAKTFSGAVTHSSTVTMSGAAIVFANEVLNVASASTVNLDAVASNYAQITGTTTITAITLANGSRKDVVFSGALTLTNGANLILPGGANITTAAGDTATFIGEASSVVRCIAYERAAISPNSGILGAGGNKVTPADTTEDILATVTIPANAMGANGMLRITANWSFNSSASNITRRIRYSGIGGTTVEAVVISGSVSSVWTMLTIANKNATNAQVSAGVSLNAAGSALIPLSVQSPAVDTTAITTVVFTGQKVNSADTLTLDHYVVELLPSN